MAIKLGMVGAGGYAFELIKRIWLIPEKIELVGVSSHPSRKSSGRAACIAKNVPVYDTPEELLSNLQGIADAIFVPTPINTHFAIAKKCIDAGFHVFLEKPPLATVQELDALNEYAIKNGKRIAVAFQFLYSDIVNETKRRIVAGEFGKVRQIRSIAGCPRFDSYYSRNCWAGKIKENGDWILDGTLNNPLAHMLVNNLYFASMHKGKLAQPVSIEAELYHGHDIQSEDTSSVRIITSDAVEILFNASLCTCAEIDTETVVECENARIRYVNFDKVKIQFKDGHEETTENKDDIRVCMLERLAHSLKSGEEFNATLNLCRPFTVCVNGAFDSCSQPKAVPAQYISRSEHSESIKTVIEGIDDILKCAHEGGKLISEMDVPWSCKGDLIDLNGYSHFPSR